ncbi:unnamed protein product, partial [Prorocentrum cordatum]
PPRRRRSPPPRARGAARRGLSGAACGAACVGGLRAPGCGAAGVDAAALGLALALCLSLAKEVGFAGPAGATAAPARKRAALSAEPGGVIGDEVAGRRPPRGAAAGETARGGAGGPPQLPAEVFGGLLPVCRGDFADR